MKTEILLEIETDEIQGEEVTGETLKRSFMENDLPFCKLPSGVDLYDTWSIKMIDYEEMFDLNDMIDSVFSDEELCESIKMFLEGRNSNHGYFLCDIVTGYILHKNNWTSTSFMYEIINKFNKELERHYNKIINGGNDNENE